MKMLIVALSGAGDVLMATPLIRELKKAYRDAKIDCLVMQGQVSRDVLKNNKDADKIIYFNFMREGFIKSLIFCNKLRKENYDISITTYPQARYHYSFISYLIGAKRRIGFNYQTQNWKLNRLFFSDVINEDFDIHVVDNNLNILEIMGLNKKPDSRLILNVNKKEREFALKYFKGNKIKKSVVIHAGSGLTKNFILKRWEKEKFSELCRELNKKLNLKILLAGGKDEEDLKNEIIKNSGLLKDRDIFNLDYDINKISAIIEKSDLVVSNDTVIGHIAAAVGTNVVSLFGPTSPRNTRPFTKKNIVICKRPENVKSWMHGVKGITNEQASFMEKISVRDVYNGIKEALRK